MRETKKEWKEEKIKRNKQTNECEKEMCERKREKIR